jgi:demethylmenaquinone methyltransferase/2-methoxy-6-polyprenyl-1,4-benzoquinol methylase
MEKKDIITFFDKCAPWWDADMVRNEDLIAMILDNGGIRENMHVLDVACGTGVLFPDYLRRGVGSLTAVDISPEMVKIAQSKYPSPQVRVFCGDVEEMTFGKQFDCIVVYNAFPHFPSPENLIRTLSGMLKPGGTLTVAHGMSRAAIDRHHEGAASAVSMGLMHEDELADIFSKYLTVTTKISNDQMYQVAGMK